MDQISSIAGAIATILGLMLGYLAISPDAQKRFWVGILQLIQLGIFGMSIWWMLSFLAREGPPSRIEIVNFAIWGFNLFSSAKACAEIASSFLRRDSRT